MRKMLSILAAAATLAISGTASAQVIPIIVLPASQTSVTPGYYQFDYTHYMVLRQGGLLLSRVEQDQIKRYFDSCDVQIGSQIRGPNPGHDTPIEMSGLHAAFNTCVRMMLADAREHNVLPGNYIIMDSSIDDSQVVVVGHPDEDRTPALPQQ